MTLIIEHVSGDLNAFSRALRRIAGLIRKNTDPEIEKTVQAIAEEAGRYEVPPRGYARTGEMARGSVSGRVSPTAWFTEMRAPHSPFVRGTPDNSHQAWMHSGVWNTYQSIIEKHTKDLEGRLDVRITAIKRSQGF